MAELLSEYAVCAESIEEVGAYLTQASGFDFVSRDSSYWGPYLLYGQAYGPHVKIYLNLDPMWREGDPESERFFKAKFPNHRVLLELHLASDQIDGVYSALCKRFPGTEELARKAFGASS